MATNNRLDWDEYFLSIVDAVSKRATCDRGKSGCIIVDDKKMIISTGYVGSVSGDEHCDDVGHLFVMKKSLDGEYSQHCIRTVHAEMNAIAQAAKRGVRIEDATLYCTMEPCFECAKVIIQCGIKRVVCKYYYHKAELTREIFHKRGIILNVKMIIEAPYDKDKE